MFQRFTSALRFGNRHDDEHSTAGTAGTAGPSKGEVIGRVLEQHPNLSVFHSDSDGRQSSSSPPTSPSRLRKHPFKRISKGPEESLRASSPTPSKLSIGKPKKVRSPLPLDQLNNQSQLSLGRATPEPSTPFTPTEPSRRPSLDALRNVGKNGPFGSLRSIRSRGSMDMLQAQLDEQPPALSPIVTGSVRSILREPNTPGTGQNVRFFSRDAYKIMTPDHSTTDIEPNAIQSLFPQTPPPPAPQPLNHEDPSSVVSRASSSPKSGRPSIADIFGQMPEPTAPSESQALVVAEKSSSINISQSSDTSNLLDLSQDIQLPLLPPGLAFDIDFDSAVAPPLSDDDKQQEGHMMTSTPYRGDQRKGKGKEREVPIDEEQPLKLEVDDSIFHHKEKPFKSPGSHSRSQSLSMGQTVFFSMMGSSKRSSTSSVVPSLASDVKTTSTTDSPSVSSIRSRSRALSDTVFQSVLRSSPSTSRTTPEEDINDEASSDVLVYSNKGPEPDPFSANARTYYTPQTMIPTTPPRGVPTHIRKTSKEDSLIVSLQTQLSLQTELCGQYQTDLRARDELVELLNQKLTDVEKEDTRRKGVLRAWKKKVAELERACRMLEDEVEGSRQESMERSLMDEASNQALRMLHRQIATLERDKGDMSRREEVLREEVASLEGMVQERSQDVIQLKEKLWKQDESQRELQEGIRQANEQVELLGNVSLCLVDDEELREQLAEARAEAERRTEEEKRRHHETEAAWESQRTELMLFAENANAEKISLEGEVETLKRQLATRDDEFTTLKAELEAQWGHAEKASERIEALLAEKAEIEQERQALEVSKDMLEQDVKNLQDAKVELDELCQTLEGEKGELEKECQDLSGALEDLQQKVENMELDFNDSENRRNELEEQVQTLGRQVQSGKDSVRYKHEHAEGLAHKLQENEARLTELHMEKRFLEENVARLEKNVGRGDEELNELNDRVLSQEREIEKLSENMAKMSREHTRIVNEQIRDLQDTAAREGEARAELEDLLKRQGEANVELRTSREKVTSLQEETERLRRQVVQLQQDSADKEVKIVQLMKGRDQDKEDLNGLNIALDSKQQELELIKRKMNVRGTAGSTPAPAKIGTAPRRDSAMFSTPSARPSSALSDSGRESVASVKERKLSSETPVKNPALARSTRANAISSISSSKSVTPKPGSMGPPPRPSVGTPTPAQRVPSLSRSSSASSTATTASVPHRRVSSTQILDASKVRAAAAAKRAALGGESPAPSETASEKDEKENLDIRSKRRASMIPTPA
ncbi:hypothetical protein AAF712_003895 [Marasmius tenuissimus]|uniref:Uncharacterized protein n=1 Tax=Marasmius tenuissimus TaxID=585030 RepID=A0ABR3A689_9AGAR